MSEDRRRSLANAAHRPVGPTTAKKAGLIELMSVNMIKLPKDLAGPGCWGINTVPYALGVRHAAPMVGAVVRRPSTHPPQLSLPDDLELQLHWN